MEEKAKSGLKSALTFLEGDVLFYLNEAEKHETGKADKLLIRIIMIAASELVARIRKAIAEEHHEEAVNHCGRCAHVTHCEDVLKYVVPCVRFEERKEVSL